MFAMVTPPVLFFAHALSNYSEVFNKINTFFQNNQGFFPIFSPLVVKSTGKHHIWGCAESEVEPEKRCCRGRGLHSIQRGEHSCTAHCRFPITRFRKKRCQVSKFTANKGFPSLFSENKTGKKVEKQNLELCKRNKRESAFVPVEKACGKTCGDCGKV